MRKTQAAITSHSPNATMKLPFSIGAILTRHGVHGKERGAPWQRCRLTS